MVKPLVFTSNLDCYQVLRHPCNRLLIEVPFSSSYRSASKALIASSRVYYRNQTDLLVFQIIHPWLSTHLGLVIHIHVLLSWILSPLWKITIPLAKLFLFHFLASVGDDVKEKKPDPSIYVTAAKVISLALHQLLISSSPSLIVPFHMKLFALQKLGVSEKDCLVVEDSVIGLQVYPINYDRFLNNATVRSL